MLIHESYHVDDYFTYGYCWKMWTRFRYAINLRRDGYTADRAGMEAYTNARTLEEYKKQFGVRAPGDTDNYDPAAHGILSCTLER